ncbi:unnamed protein product [Leptosia nina]|uniref:Uncharacterized protein n=1 Tax=Leptosia nina TaxID=320188 RepID=A0AAV1IYZ8_9NEOP
MDDTLGFSEQEKKPSEEWHLGEGEESMSSVASRFGPQNQDLQVIQKKEIPMDRPVIAATKWERLAYYRSFATSQTKTQFLCMQQEDFRTYLLNYLINVFMKSFPTTYVYTFFSAYSPDSHFFISKILPIAYGSTIAFIVSAFIELVMVTLNTANYLHYFIVGLVYHSPWNRYCDNFFSRCNNVFCFYFIVLWIGAAASYTLFFKKFLWKILNLTQMFLNIILFVTFIHLTTVYFEKGFRKFGTYETKILEVMQNSDIDLLSESMTAPPIIHILSSRSSEENRPTQDSAIIVTSNAIYYTFRGFVAYLLKLYCDNVMNTSLQDSYFSSQSLFYLWPIYFSQFYLGDLFGIMFFLLNFINEYLVIVITLQCLIEAILSEWRWLRPWMVIITLSVLGVTSFYFTSSVFFETMYVFCTSVVTLFEIIIIFYIYPLSRLVDDMTFFNGIRPTKLRLLTFWAAPCFYMLKFYMMITGFLTIVKFTNLAQEYPNYDKFIYSLAIPLVTGAIFAIYKYVFIMKMGWMQLFKPLPNWGLKYFATRQLRKRYDSRFYVKSQVPRELSRYLIQKSELNEYKLDVRYDIISQRPSQAIAQLDVEDEKKGL